MGKRPPVFAAILVPALLSLPVMALLAIVSPVLSAPGIANALSQIDAALSSGNGAEALTLTDAALGQAGLTEADRSRLLLDRGLASHLRGDPDAALSDLTQAIDTHSLSVPEQARAFLERGLVLDGLGRLDDAIGDYGAVLRLVPDSAAALNNRANALRRQNRDEDARRDYLASLAADNPAPEYPYYGLGQIAESEGKNAEAKSFYTKALAANPDYILAAQRLGALGGALAAQEPIILRPPQSMAGSAPIILHAPSTKNGFQSAAPTAPPTVRPAGFSEREGEPGLRPALDNPGGQQVQLGAWRTEAEAGEGWNRAVAASGGALSGFSPHIVAADLPGRGRYYRLRVTAPDGKQLCATLAAKGLDCIPARD